MGGILILIAVIVIVRITGLRSFAKFTLFDFAFTVAVGSLVASILTSSTSVVHGCVAIAVLLALKMITAFLQKRFPAFDHLISNQPLMLMDGSKILDKNLKVARISRSQLIAKLREANVIQLSEVRAVVLETTGDISVIHTSQETELEACLLENVKR